MGTSYIGCKRKLRSFRHFGQKKKIRCLFTAYLLGLCNPLSIEYDLERNSYDLEGTIEGDFMDGCVARLGDQSGSILYGNGFALGANERDIVQTTQHCSVIKEPLF